mgnify:CR=1 FL=1
MATPHAVPRGSRRTGNRLSADDRTTDILSAARAVIARKGYEKTLISDIAREAGVVDGTIYRYFKNKRDLLIKVAEIWFGEQLQVDARMRSTGGTEDKLRHLAWRTLAIIQREPVLARFMLMELRPDPQYKAGPFFEMNRRFTHESLQVCRDAIASGEFNCSVGGSSITDSLLVSFSVPESDTQSQKQRSTPTCDAAQNLLEEKNQQIADLSSQNNQLRRELDEIQKENADMQNQLATKDQSAQMEWFTRGGIIALVSILVGVIIAYLPKKRRRNDQWM